MECRIQLEKAKWKQNMELQVVTHCAPVLAGIKPSNGIMLDACDTMKLVYALKDTGVNLRLIHRCDEKCMWLIYRKDAIEEYLSRKEHKAYLKEHNYVQTQLSYVLKTFADRYSVYRQGGIFPHEFGLILGYPLCDVKGFISNKGQNYLYSGYWKIYGNLKGTKKIFEAYDLVRYQMIKQVEHGKSLRDIIYTYIHYQIPNIA